MLFSEISGLTPKELVKKKKELQAEMFDARMKNTLGQLPNQMVIRNARKDIARINTVMTMQAKKGASQSASKTTSKAAPAKAAKKTAAKKTSARGKKG